MTAETIYQQLKARGHKLTPQRELIINILINAPGPMTAQAIFEAVTRQYPHISFDTVYRNLGLLTDLGLVNRLRLKKKFSCYYEVAGTHRHHLVCLGCGASFPLHYCPFENIADRLTEEGGFRVVDHAFEIYGYCRQCDRKTEPRCE